MMMFSSGTNVEPMRRIDDDLPAAESLAHVIVRVALKRERHPFGDERAETLSRAALEMQFDRVLGQAFGPEAARQFAAGDRADHAVRVADGQGRVHLLAAASAPAHTLSTATACPAIPPARDPGRSCR